MNLRSVPHDRLNTRMTSVADEESVALAEQILPSDVVRGYLDEIIRMRTDFRELAVEKRAMQEKLEQTIREKEQSDLKHQQMMAGMVSSMWTWLTWNQIH